MAPDPQLVPAAYVTEMTAPEPVTELQRLHSPMPDPEPELEAGQ
jgi:hypothetical protein